MEEEIDIFTPGTYRLVGTKMPEELRVFTAGDDVIIAWV